MTTFNVNNNATFNYVTFQQADFYIMGLHSSSMIGHDEYHVVVMPIEDFDVRNALNLVYHKTEEDAQAYQKHLSKLFDLTPQGQKRLALMAEKGLI